MSSVGQAAGYIVGGIVGWFVGYPMLGAAIGGMIGGAIDPPKGPKIEGPRLSDLSQQTASFGVVLPRIYGSCAVHGNVFWIENNSLKETSKTSEAGGKGGGGGAETTEYLYSATFGLALCEGEIAAIGRIWINGKLYYHGGSADLGTIAASALAASPMTMKSGDLPEGMDSWSASGGFTLYRGAADQQPAPRMQATLGAANTPAYRGVAWILFEDLPLKDYGNTLVGAQIKVEVLSVATASNQRVKYETPYYTPHANVGFSPMPFHVGPDKIRYAAPQWDANYPATSSYRVYDVYPDGTCVESASVACPGTAVPPNQHSASGVFLYSAAQVFSGGGFHSASGFISEAGGVYAGISNASPPNIYISSGNPATQSVYPGENPDASIVTDGVHVYVSGATSTRKYAVNGTSLTLVTTGVALHGQTIAGSRLAIDGVTGRLLALINGCGGNLYRFAADLSSVALVANLTAETTGYYNGNFASFGNVVVAGAGGTPVGSNDRLWSYYHNLGAPARDTVTLGEIVGAEALLSGVLSPADIDVTSLTDEVTGYRIAAQAAIRAGLEPLQGSWPFDVVASGYKLLFVRRGAAGSVATIDAGELGAHAGGDAGAALKRSREMDLQIPWRVEVDYIDDARDYDTGTQYAERLNTGSINTSKIEMAIVMTADDAARKAEILLNAYWLERHEFTFALPPSYAHLEPADIVTISASGESHVLRLTAVQYRQDGVIECTARYHDSAGYTSTAVGANSAAAQPSIIPFGGAVATELLDVPLLAGAQDVPSSLAAMCGITSFWNGGNLFRSADGGQTWAFANGFSQQSKIGFARNSIVAPATFCLVDTSSRLSVQMYHGALAGVTELQMLNGANHFAYGADGRWEIVAARSCALEADGTYTVSGLLRGRFGTEWAAGLHAAGDALVLLDATLVQRVAMSNGQIGLDLLYRGLSSGHALASARDIAFTYRGVNLKPLSPVYASGSRHPSTNDWTLTWIRRTRTDPEWRDYVDAGLGETSEAYEVEIYSSGTYQTLKRTITGLTSPTCTYTSAQQTTDFGGVQTQLYVKIYQLSSVVGRGAPLAAPIPYKSSALGIYHLDSLPAKNEVTGLTYGAGGNGQISTSTGVQFGSGAFYSNTSGYLWLAFANATALADFTLEMWLTGQTGGPIIEGNLNVSSNNLRLAGGYGAVVTTWPSQDEQTKIHFAISRKDGVIKVFFAGIQKNTDVTNNTVMDLSSLALGYFAGGPSYSYAYFDEVRLSDVCLYSENFTPPAAPFTLPSGVW